MSSTRRPPAGYYRNGLAGWAHDPTVGLVGAAGLHLHEDWLAYQSGGTSRYGEVGWTRASIGSTPNVILNTPTAATEIGIGRLGTHSQSNRGGTLHLAGLVQLYEPPVGMVWCYQGRPKQHEQRRGLVWLVELDDGQGALDG